MFSKYQDYELLTADERSKVQRIQYPFFKRLRIGDKTLFTTSGSLLVSLTLNVLLSIHIIRLQPMPLLGSRNVDARSHYGMS